MKRIKCGYSFSLNSSLMYRAAAPADEEVSCMFPQRVLFLNFFRRWLHPWKKTLIIKDNVISGHHFFRPIKMYCQFCSTNPKMRATSSCDLRLRLIHFQEPPLQKKCCNNKAKTTVWRCSCPKVPPLQRAVAHVSRWPRKIGRYAFFWLFRFYYQSEIQCTSKYESFESPAPFSELLNLTKKILPRLCERYRSQSKRNISFLRASCTSWSSLDANL